MRTTNDDDFTSIDLGNEIFSLTLSEKLTRKCPWCVVGKMRALHETRKQLFCLYFLTQKQRLWFFFLPWGAFKNLDGKEASKKKSGNKLDPSTSLTKEWNTREGFADFTAALTDSKVQIEPELFFLMHCEISSCNYTDWKPSAAQPISERER